MDGAETGELLSAARTGDLAALGRLMDDCRGYLLKVVNECVPAPARGKVPPSDVVQETFLEAYRIFVRFDGAGADAFRAWLAGIVQNKAREAVRRFHGTDMRDPGREVGLSGASAAAAGTTPSRHAMRREESGAVRDAITRLPAEYQDVIRQRTWDDLEFAEIGARSGRSENAARMLFARALKRLELELSHADRRTE